MSTIKVDTYLTRGGASEIAIDKLKGASSAGSLIIVGEGGSATTVLQQGLAKFWIQHNDGASVADSFNQASTTDNGTGDYSHSFTNNMRASSNYAMSGLALAVNDKATYINANSANVEFLASSFRYQTGYVPNTSGGQTNHDCNATSPVVHGDLA